MLMTAGMCLPGACEVQCFALNTCLSSGCLQVTIPWCHSHTAFLCRSFFLHCLRGCCCRQVAEQLRQAADVSFCHLPDPGTNPAASQPCSEQTIHLTPEPITLHPVQYSVLNRCTMSSFTKRQIVYPCLLFPYWCIPTAEQLLRPVKLDQQAKAALAVFQVYLLR